MESIYYSTEAIPSISLPDEDEQRVTMPLSMYKELMRIYRLYMNQTGKIPSFNPDPVAPDYTRPQPND